MGQLENVQRGVLFTFFIYSIVIFAFTVIKMIQNRIDIQSQQESGGGKYKEEDVNKPKNKPAEQTKSDLEVKPEPPKPQKAHPKQQASTNQLYELQADKQNLPKQDDTFIVKITKKLHYHVLYHLPMFFPFALNIVTGTSYAFLFVLFFFVQVTFALFNDLKIQNNCVENKVIKALLLNVGYILTFFCWINLWGASTASMPFLIKSG